MSKISRYSPRPSYTKIEGLSETRRIPRAGKIRLGIKVKKKNPDRRCTHAPADTCFFCTYPRDVDYFVCPPEVREVYGERPTELDILLPCEDDGLFFPQALKWYKGSRLMCKGNRRVATRINEATGEMFERECPCEHYTGEDEEGKPFPKDCSERANLMVLLPRVSLSRCYQVDTGSVNAIIGINSYLDWLRGIVRRVSFVPLKLVREKTPIQYVDPKAGAKTTEKAIVSILLPPEINYERLEAFRSRDIISIEGRDVKVIQALPPAPVEDGADGSPGEVIVEENGEKEEKMGQLGTPWTEEINAEEIQAEPDIFPEDNSTDDIPFVRKVMEEVLAEEQAKRTRSEGPPISKNKANIIRALFLSKGIKEHAEMDRHLMEWYAAPADELPEKDYEAAKGMISNLPKK